MGKQNCIIYCECGAGIISGEKKNQLSDTLKQLNADVFELHDLCAFSLKEKEFLSELNAGYQNKFVVACYPRAIKNMFAQNKVEFENYEVLNFRELSAGEIQPKLEDKLEGSAEEGSYQVKKSDLDVPAWYPIIEESRCTLCGQCARFCVFGVYSYNRKSLEVVNPLSCKNNCPACGRTCPASAIIFPRLAENSVLSGAEPGQTKIQPRAAQKQGLFVLLNERNTTRRNIFRQDVKQLAEEEKRKAIEELKKRAKE